MGALDGYIKRIIVSDGGPGHFKVYKTQNWMSRWDEHLRKKFQISTEWNMYFANLGHNLCDGHAGKMKVYVYVCLTDIILSQSVGRRGNLKGIIMR